MDKYIMKNTNVGKMLLLYALQNGEQRENWKNGENKIILKSLKFKRTLNRNSIQKKENIMYIECQSCSHRQGNKCDMDGKYAEPNHIYAGDKHCQKTEK